MNHASGLGLFQVLTLIFIVLKLTGVINWSWIWVLSPLWIPFLIGMSMIVITLITVKILYMLGR